MCRQKDAKTVQGCALKTRSPCCAGAQNGEPPPLSPPRRRGTMGQENKYFKVGGLRFLQALTPRERYSRFIVASPSGPLSRLGKGGGGKGQMRLWLPWERICAQYGLIFGSRRKSIRIQRSRATGFSGRSPEPFLHPFVGTKGCPRRVGVQTKFSKKLAPPQARRNDVMSIRRRRQQTISQISAESEKKLSPKYPPPEAEPYYFVQSDPSDLENRRYYEQHRTGKTKPL